MALRCFVLLAACCLPACQGDLDPSSGVGSRPQDAAHRLGGDGIRPHTSTSPALRAIELAPPGEVWLDLRADGARLSAAVQPVPPNSDAPRALRVRWLERHDSPGSSWAFDGVPVLDARFVPGSEAAVVITAARELVWLGSPSARPTPLDSEVHAPLSLSQDGRTAAYARGEIPDLEIVRYDLGRQARVGGTETMAPAWSPALSEDGSRVLFVSGKTGYPELWELAADQSVVQRTDRRRDPIPFPAGPSAPLWQGNTLVFEDPEGVHVLSVDPPRWRQSLRGTLPLGAVGSQAFLLQDRGDGGPRWVSFEGAEVAP